jgi:hypothetical protein
MKFYVRKWRSVRSEAVASGFGIQENKFGLVLFPEKSGLCEKVIFIKTDKLTFDKET